MTIDALLASACLPQLFQAVEIDGEPYWDGGYSGNPTLWPMIQGGPARDLIVVQLTPDAAPNVPRDVAAIRRRVGEIVFHSSLVAEMQAITAMRTVAAHGEAGASVLDLRMHRIGPPRAQLFEEGSALERSRAWIDRLYAEGRHGARRFLARHGRDIGVRETLDIAKVFTDERKPKLHLPANEAAFDPRLAPDRKSVLARAAGGGRA
jgi:NTE family protein